MHSGNRSTKIVAILFLACFVIYSASPLACTVETDRRAGNELTEPGEAHVCLYLVELLLSGFDDNRGSTAGQSDETDSDHILVRKKRAVLSSNKSRCAGYLVTLEKVSAPQVSYIPALGSVEQQHCLHPTQNLALPLYSGKAPPSV
jgi:hypothetical protein